MVGQLVAQTQPQYEVLVEIQLEDVFSCSNRCIQDTLHLYEDLEKTKSRCSQHVSLLELVKQEASKVARFVKPGQKALQDFLVRHSSQVVHCTLLVLSDLLMVVV